MQVVENTEMRAVPMGEKFMLTIKEAAPYYEVEVQSLEGLEPELYEGV